MRGRKLVTAACCCLLFCLPVLTGVHRLAARGGWWPLWLTKRGSRTFERLMVGTPSACAHPTPKGARTTRHTPEESLQSPWLNPHVRRDHGVGNWAPCSWLCCAVAVASNCGRPIIRS